MKWCIVLMMVIVSIHSYGQVLENNIKGTTPPPSCSATDIGAGVVDYCVDTPKQMTITFERIALCRADGTCVPIADGSKTIDIGSQADGGAQLAQYVDAESLQRKIASGELAGRFTTIQTWVRHTIRVKASTETKDGKQCQISGGNTVSSGPGTGYRSFNLGNMRDLTKVETVHDFKVTALGNDKQNRLIDYEGNQVDMYEILGDSDSIADTKSLAASYDDAQFLKVTTQLGDVSLNKDSQISGRILLKGTNSIGYGFDSSGECEVIVLEPPTYRIKLDVI